MVVFFMVTTTDRQREYRDVYLQSEHWRRIRELALDATEFRAVRSATAARALMSTTAPTSASVPSGSLT